MSNIFIKKIRINTVRHLQGIEIPISETERKHLIITGKNGSGKTSVLQAIKNHLSGIQNYQLLQLPKWKQEIEKLKENIILFESQLKSISDEQNRMALISQIEQDKNSLKKYEQQIHPYSAIELTIHQLELVQTEYHAGNYIISFFDAKRTTTDQLKTPNGIQKLELKPIYNIEEKANPIFIQYLVNLKAQRSFARDANNMKVAEDIDAWFHTFEGYLKEIFEDNNLILEFDSEKFDFNIIQSNKEKFNLNTLSDGYSAIVNIVTELIVRMEKRSPKTYELQGIVLIDEIEIHLHIELQKLILPFLTKIFPKIQFIVSTHSPFVLNSISNAVIYDLENNLLVSDLSGYSVEGIIEGYFDSDKYSSQLKKLVNEYEQLSMKKNLIDPDKTRVRELKKYFNDLSKFLAPELELKIQQIELLNLIQK